MTRHIPAETSQNLRQVTVQASSIVVGGVHTLFINYVVTDDLGNPLPNEPVETVVDALDVTTASLAVTALLGTLLNVGGSTAAAPVTASTSARAITGANGGCDLQIAHVPAATYNITSQIGSRRILTPITTV